MNMQKMMKQAQKMQAEMARAQEEISEMSFEGSAGGGIVTATAKGDMTISSITINPIAIDPEDPEMLSDMVVAAVNSALAGVSEMSSARMSSATAGVSIPGLM